MVRITPINNNKETVFGDLRIGAYFLIKELSCKELFIKTSNDCGHLLSNGEFYACFKDTPVTLVKNVSIEYEV